MNRREGRGGPVDLTWTLGDATGGQEAVLGAEGDFPSDEVGLPLGGSCARAGAARVMTWASAGQRRRLRGGQPR